MEIEGVTEQQMGHQRNQRRNKKIPRDKWKQKHNMPKSMGCTKRNSKRRVKVNVAQSCPTLCESMN